MGRGPGRSPRSVMTTPPSDWGEGSNTPMCQHPKSTHTLQVPPQGPRSCAWPGRRSRHGQAGWGHGRGSSDPLLTTGHREDRTRGCSPSSSPEAQQRPRNGRATERSARGVAVFKQHLTGVSGPDTGGRSRRSARRPRTPARSRLAPRQPRQEAPGHSVFSVPRPPRGPWGVATGPRPREAKDLQGWGLACVASHLPIMRVGRRRTAAPQMPDDGLEATDGAAGRAPPAGDMGVCAWEQGRPRGCGTTFAESRTQGCPRSWHMRIF